MSDISNLRASAIRKHKAATSKASRLKRQGIEVAGSIADPRRDLSVVKKYNKAQLNAYIRKLDSFNSRNTKFVQGHNGAALPAHRLAVYQREQERYNRRASRHYDSVKDTFLPQRGMSVEERDTYLRPKGRVKAQGDSVTRPYDPISRTPEMFRSAAGLEVAIADMRKRNSKSYLPSKLREQKYQAYQMVDRLGNEEMKRILGELTDEQFDTMWNYSSIANEMSMNYEILEMQARGKKERSHAKVYDDGNSEILEILSWAKRLPKR